MTPTTLKTAPVTTGHDFGIEPFELTCRPLTAAGFEHDRRDLDAQLRRFHWRSSKERVWARSRVAPNSRHLPDHRGQVTVRTLMEYVRKDYQQLRVEWDGTRLALSVTHGARVRSEHWRPLSPAQGQLWLDLSRRVTPRFRRLASVIAEQPAPLVQVALTLTMHVWLSDLPAFLEFDADVFTPTLAEVKAVWPEGGLDLVAFDQLADGWPGTGQELLRAAVAVTT